MQYQIYNRLDVSYLNRIQVAFLTLRSASFSEHNDGLIATLVKNMSVNELDFCHMIRQVLFALR